MKTLFLIPATSEDDPANIRPNRKQENDIPFEVFLSVNYLYESQENYIVVRTDNKEEKYLLDWYEDVIDSCSVTRRLFFIKGTIHICR